MSCRTPNELKKFLSSPVIPKIALSSTVAANYVNTLAYGILVPSSGTEPQPLVVKVLSPNHWTTREFPICDY